MFAFMEEQMRMTLLGVAMVLMAAGAPRGVAAAEIKVLTAGAFKQVLLVLVPEFEKQTGHKVILENDTVGALMVDLARRNTFPWDAILGAETAGDYKPKPRVYLAACAAFDLPPGECMMVAAHTNDLLAAAQCGLRTGHVARPNEHGPGTGEAAPKAPVDVAASSLEDLAARLEA
jgi:phosphoglycolate phosphatase-like HAD superfamily hydrolase